MTPRTRSGQFAKKPTMTPSDQILDDACRDVIHTIRLGDKIGRTIPTSALAARLELAAGEYDDASLRATRDSATTRAGEGDHVWGAVGPNAAELWNRCVNCRADEGSFKGRQPCLNAQEPSDG